MEFRYTKADAGDYIFEARQEVSGGFAIREYHIYKRCANSWIVDYGVRAKRQEFTTRNECEEYARKQAIRDLA